MKNIQMMQTVALVTVLVMAGCSRSGSHVTPQDQFVFDRLPQVGEDCSGVIQSALEWAFDPRRTSSLPGYSKFRVTNAIVFASDRFVPRPNGGTSTFRFHLHLHAILPSGQVIDEDGVETIDGVWEDNQFVFCDWGATIFPAHLDKEGDDKIYAAFLQPGAGRYNYSAYQAQTEASVIQMLFGIPFKASGSVDLSNWQRIHDLALTRHDLLQDQP